MAEHGGAEVVHHALPDLIGKQRLNHAEDAGRDRDRDYAAGVERERRRVVVRDRLEHALEQEGGDHSQPRRDDDQKQNTAESQLVRREEPADPAQIRAPQGPVGRTFGRRFGGVKEHAHEGSE